METEYPELEAAQAKPQCWLHKEFSVTHLLHGYTFFPVLLLRLQPLGSVAVPSEPSAWRGRCVSKAFGILSTSVRCVLASHPSLMSARQSH